MRNILLILSLCSAISSIAQTAITDSVFIGAQYKDAVYYELSTGNKTTSLNTNWHLAFSVQKADFPSNTLPSVSIRFNEGGTGMGLFQKAFSDTAFFTGDTSGFETFNRLYDTDNNMDTGAFNRGINISQFDYGWGIYNLSTKNIPGRSVFYLKLNSGIKKLRIVELTADTLWQIQYANLDNSNLQSISIPKRSYLGKLYAYLNIETNEVLDREPLANAWDLLFHKYFARDVPGLDGYPSVGVWSNKGVEVAEARNTDKATAVYTDYTFSKNMSEIGRDWKEFVTPVWEIEDSLAYFVKLKGGNIYKLILTEFAGSSTGKIVFEKTLVSGSTSVKEIANVKMQCYPNPASDFMTVLTDVDADAEFSLTDLSGRIVLKEIVQSGFAATKINLQNTLPGIYIAAVEQNGNRAIQRIVVNR